MHRFYLIILKLSIDMFDVRVRPTSRRLGTMSDSMPESAGCSGLNVETLRLIKVSPELLQFCQSLIPGGTLSFAR